MRLTRHRIIAFQNKIFSWWEDNRRDLPWRRTRDPYKILVSEIMLQQTQVGRVLPKYEEFLYFFPDVYALAEASPASVLRLWKGMGYNRRALYLKKAAEAVVRDFHGEFPENESELRALPGLGTYTARAILVFAFGQDTAMVDTNIRQIITHFFFADVWPKESMIQEVADKLVPAGRSWEWHQALMDYGSSELPKLRRPRQRKKIVQPFRDSNRFYRGRVIDLLREGDVFDFVLLKKFHDEYDKPEEFVDELLRGLERDGLILREHKTISLPH